MGFSIEAEDNKTKARAGNLKLPSGKSLKTPFFMPVMTKGVAKNMSQEMLLEAGTKCGIANSFVLSIKPGAEFIEKSGGLHKIASWDGAYFTDSGGFQMLSESFFKDIDNEYVYFKNPYTCQIVKLSPEECMNNQLRIGSDVAMALDHVPPHYGMTKEKMLEHLRRTHYWAKRCKIEHDKLQKKERKQLLFGITQGGIYDDLRAESARFIDKVGFDGIAFGGFCFGESDSQIYSGIKISKDNISKESPVYIMGMGHPVQILESIALGCDIFDSTFPTMNGRNGTLFTLKGNLRLLRNEYRYDNGPIETGCDCYTCRKYTRSYVRYLLEMKENLGKTLATIHNVHFMHRLTNTAQEKIKSGDFLEYLEEFRKNFKKDDNNTFNYN